MVEGSGREEMDFMEIVGLLPGASVRPGSAACFRDVTLSMLCGGIGWPGLAVQFLRNIRALGLHRMLYSILYPLIP